jgi:hypothetical protein
VSDDSYTWDWAKLHIEYRRLREALEKLRRSLNDAEKGPGGRILYAIDLIDRALSGGEGEGQDE